MNEHDYFSILAAECNGNGDCNMCIVPLEICKEVNEDLEGD